MTNDTRSARLRLYCIAQLIFPTRNKEKRLNLFVSPTLYESIITPQNVISNILKKKSSTQRTNSIPTPEELVCMFFKWAVPSDCFNYAVLPYINGISQPLTRLLKNMIYELSISHSGHCSKSFPLPSPDLRLICNLTWFTKYPVLTAHGVM